MAVAEKRVRKRAAAKIRAKREPNQWQKNLKQFNADKEHFTIPKKGSADWGPLGQGAAPPALLRTTATTPFHGEHNCENHELKFDF